MQDLHLYEYDTFAQDNTITGGSEKYVDRGLYGSVRIEIKKVEEKVVMHNMQATKYLSCRVGK